MTTEVADIMTSKVENPEALKSGLEAFMLQTGGGRHEVVENSRRVGAKDYGDRVVAGELFTYVDNSAQTSKYGQSVVWAGAG